MPEDPKIPARYAGKPMLVILENFVLACIGELPGEKFKVMGEVIHKAWGVAEGAEDGDWRITVREKLDLPEDTEADLLALWQRNKSSITAEDFARTIVDQNYKDIVE